MQYRKNELVKISLAGGGNEVTCRQCKKTEAFYPTDLFTPLRVPSLKTNGRTEVTLKSNVEFVRYFIEQHWKMHTEQTEVVSV